MTDNTRKLIEQILAIPAGKVSSYRNIALKGEEHQLLPICHKNNFLKYFLKTLTK